MKAHIVTLSWILTGMLSAFAQEASLPGIYSRARAALNQAVQFAPFQNVSTTDGIQPDLVGVVNELQDHRYAMAEFLCATIADKDRLDFTDAILLRDVAGIDLIWSEQLISREGVNMDKSLQHSFASFKHDFRAKVLDDPSEPIRKACTDLQGRNVLTPSDVMRVRRYGLFGIPALIEEIRSRGSRHALAASLIILGKHQAYSEYLERADTLYPSKAEKLEAVRGAVQSVEARQKVRTKLLKQVGDVASITE